MDNPPPDLLRCARSRGPARALGGQVQDAVVSADGGDVYVWTAHGIGLFRRDRHNGRLGENGCVGVPEIRRGCLFPGVLQGRDPLFTDPHGLALTPDGRHLYVGWSTGRSGAAVIVFERNLMTGAVRDVGCVSDDGAGGRCTDGVALESASVIGVSRDGRRLWAHGSIRAPRTRDGVVGALLVFARDAVTGQLSQLGCAVVRRRHEPCSRLVLEPGGEFGGSTVLLADGQGVVVGGSGGITVIRLGADGVMREVSCWNPRGTRGCRRLSGTEFVMDLELAPDGRYLYVASIAGRADRHTISWYAVRGHGSVLVRRGCVSSVERGPCRHGHGILTNGADLELAAGEAFLVGSGPVGRGGNLTIFDRDEQRGPLRQTGCLSSLAEHGCTRVPQLRNELFAAAVSPDARNIYVSPSGLAVFVALGRGTGIADHASWNRRHRLFRVALTCPAARFEGCAGSLRLATEPRAVRQLGSTAYALVAGTTKHVSVRIGRSMWTHVTPTPRTIQATTTDARGIVRANRRTVRIRPTR